MQSDISVQQKAEMDKRYKEALNRELLSLKT